MIAAAACVPEKRHVSTRLEKIVALRRVSEAIGQERLADALGVAVRTLRSYTSGERDFNDGVVNAAALALDERAAELCAQAYRLRRLVDGGER